MADIRLVQKGDRATLILNGELTIRYAKELKAALLDAIQDSASVEVALGEVSALDCSFLQLICSAQRTAAGAQKPFLVDGADQERVADRLRRSGLARRAGGRGNSTADCFRTQGPPPT